MSSGTGRLMPVSRHDFAARPVMPSLLSYVYDVSV
jgi:hypothetical protein